MSFSSRKPASHRQRVARTRAGTRPPRSPAKHLRLWQAIRKTRAELSQWLQRAEQVDSLFRQHILPRETRLTTACAELTDRLMDRHEEGGLTSARQALLTLWVADNLRSLNTHPFISDTQRSALAQRWHNIQSEESARNAAHLSNSDPGTAGLVSDVYDDDELDEDDVVFDFGWHDSASSRGKHRNGVLTDSDRCATDPLVGKAYRTAHREEFRSAEDEPGQVDDEAGQATNDMAAKVSELEQRFSVDRLFRQLARVLHPDREQNESLKAEKHELMSQCLQARHDRDINTLLTLYCQHVGELPDDLSDTDHDDLINALRMQLRQLQNELRQQRFSDPLRAQIVERYSAGDEQQTLQRVMRHARSLDAESENMDALRLDLDSDDSFYEALEARRAIELDRMDINRMTGYS